MPSPTTIGLFALAGFGAILFLVGLIRAVRKGLNLRSQTKSRAEVMELIRRAEKVGQQHVVADLNPDLIEENRLVQKLYDEFAGSLALAVLSLIICAVLLGIWYFSS